VKVELITPRDVLLTARKTLGLPVSDEPGEDVSLLSGIVRRAAGVLCPCSRATIISATLDAVEILYGDEGIRVRIEEVVDALVAIGDLLELSGVTVDDPAVKSTWVFAAPPSFVIRPNGIAFLAGIAADEALPLPPDFRTRVSYSGCCRTLAPQSGENLPSILAGFGFIQHSEKAWLRSPKAVPAKDFLFDLKQRLSALPPSGDTEGLLIIDPSKPNNYYRGRWTAPKNHTGVFVGRREREYGAPLWGLASLENGMLKQFLDLPLKGFKWRGCDAAWHIQMALDSTSSVPQRYRRRPGLGGFVVLDFFSPLPQWAERRLAIIGDSVPREKCLFSYAIANDELEAEENFLAEYLWLSPTDT